MLSCKGEKFTKRKEHYSVNYYHLTEELSNQVILKIWTCIWRNFEYASDLPKFSQLLSSLAHVFYRSYLELLILCWWIL